MVRDFSSATTEKDVRRTDVREVLRVGEIVQAQPSSLELNGGYGPRLLDAPDAVAADR